MNDKDGYRIYGGLNNLERIIKEGVSSFSEEDNKVLKNS